MARASNPKANCIETAGETITRSSSTPPNDSSASEVTCEVVKTIKPHLASVIICGYQPCYFVINLNFCYPLATTKIIDIERNRAN